MQTLSPRSQIKLQSRPKRTLKQAWRTPSRFEPQFLPGWTQRTKACPETAGGGCLPCPGCDCGKIPEALGRLLHAQRQPKAPRQFFSRRRINCRCVRYQLWKCRIPRDCCVLEPEHEIRLPHLIPRPRSHSPSSFKSSIFIQQSSMKIKNLKPSCKQIKNSVFKFVFAHNQSFILSELHTLYTAFCHFSISQTKKVTITQ